MRPRFLVLTALFSFLAWRGAQATEVHGTGELGLWYLQNNVADSAAFVADDNVGVSYVEKRYTLANFGLRLEALDLLNGGENPKLNTRFKGRLLWNVGEHGTSLGVPDKTRQQIDEFSAEIAGIGEGVDLWVGRQTLYEAGGIGVDGVRGIYHVSKTLNVGAYGGLSNDPRNLTGYIGPSYKSGLFSARFQSGGAYISQQSERLKVDAAFNAELFKAKMNRLTLFSQAVYQLNPVWGFSALTTIGVAGDRGLKSVAGVLTSRPMPRITNTLSFSRYATLVYRESTSSAILVPAGIDAALVGGNDVSTSSYNSGREHLQIRVLDRNYIFGAFQFTRRTFDGQNQLKYTAGYRDPTLFGSTFDLRLQTDVIDNYRGFSTVFDTLLGKEFLDGALRLEGGATFYANERDLYVGNLFAQSAGEVEKEYSLRFNLYCLAGQKISWFLNYALHNEKDVANNRQKVRTHDLYVATNFRF